MANNSKRATPSTGSGDALSKSKRAGRTGKILDYLRSYYAERGLAPTYREISHACNIPTTSVVRYHLDELERQGLVKCHRNISRGTVLLDPPNENGRDH